MYAVSGYRDSKFKKILKYLNFMLLGSIVSIFIGKKYDYVFGFNLGPLTDMLPAVIIPASFACSLTNAGSVRFPFRIICLILSKISTTSSLTFGIVDGIFKR